MECCQKVWKNAEYNCHFSIQIWQISQIFLQKMIEDTLKGTVFNIMIRADFQQGMELVS